MKWARLIPLLLIPLLGGLFYTFQRMDNSIVETPEQPVSLPRYTLSDAELTRYDADGQTSLHGLADTIDYFDDQSGHAHNLRLDLVADDDRTWHLSSPTATLPPHQHRFMLDGPVLAQGQWPDNGEDLSLHTDRMWVDPDRREIDTDAAVEVSSTSRSGSATGLRSDWTGQSIQLQHNVKMTYQTPSPGHEH